MNAKRRRSRVIFLSCLLTLLVSLFYPPLQTSPEDYLQIDYLIITSDALGVSGAFLPLVDSKDARGLSAQLVSVEDIATVAPCRDLPERIRNLIIEAYKYNGLTWVLLGGDTNIVPPRFVAAFGGYTVENEAFHALCHLYQL